ncbi:MAG: ATP-dependent DNA helicase [Nanoarchaeota archaeon]
MEYLTKTTGPCVVLAGAGTGKTYSIIEKIKYLIQKKIYQPNKIVCLTFSNEAVNTIRERMFPFLTGKEEPVIRTFHSFCADLLRKRGEKIGIKQDFKIVLPDDGKILMHKYFKIHPTLCASYIEQISILKDLCKTIEKTERKINDSLKDLENLLKKLDEINFQLNTAHLKKIDLATKAKLQEKKEFLEHEIKKCKFVQAWKSYEKIKSLKNGLDYADLNIKALELLKNFPEVSEEYEYLIIDEFQDTNKLQCELITKIAPHKNITIVGDLNQSIYRFRGAYKDNFNFIKKELNITNNDIFKLDKSHRSTNKILSVSHKLIKNNYPNPEECFEVKSVRNEQGDPIEIYELNNAKEEARKTIELIKKEIERSTPFKEICVIFRTHQQANLLKKELAYQSIPYTTITKESLLKTPAIKKVRAYLVLINKFQNSLKGGDSCWWELFHSAGLSKKDEIECTKELQKLKENECLTKEIINSGLSNISNEARKKLNAVCKIIKSVSELKSPTIETITKLYQLLGFQSADTKEEQEQILTLEKFYVFAKEFSESESPELSLFMYHLDLLDALGISIEAPEISKEGIKIMTNHATKGLEYTSVIMSCLAQKKFPIEIKNKNIISIEESNDDESQLAEERRLCYVGFTRAKKRLYLTYAKEYGKRAHEPSQFLKEIDYQNNPNIIFVKDTSNSYQEHKELPKPEMQEASELEQKEISFSPSALQKFDECQKRYEYKYVYNMPDPTPKSWGAITLGNFIHRVLEEGVKKNLKTIKEFEDCAKIIQAEEFKDSNLEEAIPMIRTFVGRNNEKYNQNSMTEQWLTTNIDGIKFTGYADRIDISDEGEVTIVDYKTGKSEIKPKYRNWQLGLYALAAKKFGMPKTLVLEMLQKDHPLEFEIDNKGIAKEIHSAKIQFSLEEVKKELVQTARAIIKARQEGFKPCPSEKNCDFCEEWVY